MKLNISDILGTNNKTNTKAKQLHTGEVFALWQHLLLRYDTYEMTDIFENFANDVEFKGILSLGKTVLSKEILELEKQMDSYGIPLPPRPPKSINTSANTEVLRDELMFRLIYMGIQNFLTQHIRTILNTSNEDLLTIFKKFEDMEMELFTKLQKYAQFKGWIFIPPAYKNS
ncbi:DUF3231 family protein [Natronospora cellulosivora (SeqCode)]